MAAPTDKPIPISISLLVSAPTNPHLQARIEELPPLDAEASRVLVSGVPRSGKTSMLFHLSCAAAARGRSVVWLASQARLEQSPPQLPAGVLRGSPALSAISFKYVAGLPGLKAYGACLHLLPAPPCVLVVDDLTGLGGGGPEAGRGTREAEVTKALALLVDALEQARESTGRACQLFVSDTAAEDGPRSHYLLARWFHAVVSLAGAPPGGLALHVAPRSAQVVPPALAAARLHYLITQGAPVAEALTSPG